MAEPVRFGKYLLTRSLAKGGMATVHLAILPGVEGFEKELVVKQILPDLARDARFVELFVSEAKNAVSLQHGNIVPVYELGIVDGTYFIAMERVRGRTLAEVLDAAVPLPPEAAVHVALEVLRALAHAHGRSPPLVHRDLSSRNVMMTYDGEVKVLDFGIAGRAGSSGSGAPLGSFGYLAPEQLEGRPADRRSDLFAVGVLLHEMLTGEPLFARADSAEGRAEVLRGRSPRPSSIRASAPAELDAPVLAALERDVEARVQSAEEMAEPLRKWLASRGGFDGGAIGRLLRERLPEERAGSEPLEGTLPLADPAAAARQVTIATSVALATAEGSSPRPSIAPRSTFVPRESRRIGLAMVGLPIALLVAIAALLFAPENDPPRPVAPRTTRPRPETAATTAAPRTAEPTTAGAATSEPRSAVALRPARLKVLALPWAELTVNGRSYGRSFPSAGIEIPPSGLRIRAVGPHGEIAEGTGLLRAGRETVCNADFRTDVHVVACEPPR